MGGFSNTALAQTFLWPILSTVLKNDMKRPNSYVYHRRISVISESVIAGLNCTRCSPKAESMWRKKSAN